MFIMLCYIAFALTQDSALAMLVAAGDEGLECTKVVEAHRSYIVECQA